jgi:DNA-binding beta-propeller fold protein YncE
MKNVLYSLSFLVLFCFSALTSANAQGYNVYAALYKENNLAIINPGMGKIIQRIQVGRNPDNIVFNADKTKLYVANTGEYSISIVDIATNLVEQVLRLPVNRRNIYTGTTAASPDASKLYVAERGDKPEPLRVYVIDMNLGKQVAQFNVGNNVNSMAVSSDGTKLFVVDKESKAISVYSTDNYAVVGTVPLLKGLEAKALCIACSTIEQKAFISYGDENKIQIVNTADYKTLATIKMPKYKTGSQRDIIVGPKGKYAFIINDKSGYKDVDGILVLDIAKKEIIKIFNSGNVPRGMTVTDDGNTFYVASSMMKWYNLLTLEHLKSMSLQTEIRGIVLMPK